MRLLMAGVALVYLAGCGSAEPNEPATSVADSAVTTTTTAGTVTTTAPPPTAAPTTTFDPLANLPEAGTAAFERTTHRIDIDALPIDDDDALSMDRVIDHIGFYASSYVPEASRFVRFSSMVGQGFSPEVFVTETLAVSLRHNGTAGELADLVSSQIAAALPGPVEWGSFPGFPYEVTFGRELTPTPLIRAAVSPNGLVAFAVASPTPESPDTYTLYVRVTEGHPDASLSDVPRPPSVGNIEQALTAEWAIEEPWMILDWESSLYLNDETGEIEPGLLFDVWFEAPAEQLRQSLLATGSWSEHPDFPPNDQGFWLYSATGWLQGLSQRGNTSVIVTANP